MFELFGDYLCGKIIKNEMTFFFLDFVSESARKLSACAFLNVLGIMYPNIPKPTAPVSGGIFTPLELCSVHPDLQVYNKKK